MSDNFKDYIEDFFHDLELYDDIHNNYKYKDLLKSSILSFLHNETPLNALDIYELFFMIYNITPEYRSNDKNKNNVKEINIPLDFAKLMFKYDENNVNSPHGSTFVHSVNVFILGLAVYSQNERYRDCFRQYVFASHYDDYFRDSLGQFSHEEFMYRWGIASLFHDITISVETMGKTLKKSLDKELNSIFYNNGESLTINLFDLDKLNSISKIDFSFMDEYNEDYPTSNFLNLFKPTQIMLHKLSLDFGIGLRQINLLENYFRELSSLEHGFLSSIIVLKFYGYIFQNYGLRFTDFFYPIVDSATAILLHNFYKDVLLKEPYNLKQLNPSHNPLAYLLILCDEIQEWKKQPFQINGGKIIKDDLRVKIDGDMFYVEYIVNSSSMGLGFSEDKEELLNRILSIRSIFKESLNIIAEVKQDENILKKIIRSEYRPPNIIFPDIEKLAIQIHKQYNQTTANIYSEQLKNGVVDEKTKENYENLTSFGELSSNLKLMNIRQARLIPKKLNVIGCELANLSDDREPIREFSSDETLDLAMYEHDEWCREKIGAGWTYGKVRDDSKLIHDCLVPWQDLSPEIQQYDIDPVRNLPNLVNSIGLKIVRNKIRLLAVEMHKFYQSQLEGTVDFEDLPESIKYANYKQVDFLVKNLNDLDYIVVENNFYGESIDSFNEYELEYFARKEHNAWYIEKINLGWKYGPYRDDELKTNPNVVTWAHLNSEQKEFNKLTFRHMPEMCKNLGLKIIRK